MANLKDLKEFRENILLKMSNDEKEKKLKEFLKDDTSDIDYDSIYNKLAVLRGR